jgi:hypothetical protein
VDATAVRRDDGLTIAGRSDKSRERRAQRAVAEEGELERLDMLRADRWGRLRDGVRRCQLRRGAWYPVLRVGADAVVVVVRHQSVIVPPSYLEIVVTRPSKWTVIGRERYAVCPNCAERVALGAVPERMRCCRCRGEFAVELEPELSAPR